MQKRQIQELPFFKYQGTGNDFILIDQRETQWLTRESVETVNQLCDRHFGIGADGLILLENHPVLDFEMIYFNSDGNESSMCGNGGRCIVAFANFLGIVEEDCQFMAVDGLHHAVVKENWVELRMNNVHSIKEFSTHFFLNTGSPHHVAFTDDLSKIDIVTQGRSIRNSKNYKPDGTNVNFVEEKNNGIEVLTYERGVEDETLSCGTGVTAAAISYALRHPDKKIEEVPIRTKGGFLKVRFQKEETHFKDIWLCGPALQVFKGTIPF